MIRRRLVVGVTLTVALAIGLGSWLTVRALEDRLIANVDEQFVSSDIGNDIREQLVDRRFGQRNADVVDERRQAAYVQYSPTAQVTRSVAAGTLADPQPLPAGADLPANGRITTVGSVDDDGPRYRAIALATNDGGRVVVALSLADVDDTLREARRIQLFVGIGAIGIVGVLCLFMIRRAFSPIDGMIETAGQIADGDLAQRTEVEEADTEVGRLGTALNRMLDRIEDAVDEKTRSEERMRRFVADASHDLRTPLTTVRGYADLYRQGANDSESVALGMERIEAEATRMSRLVDDLMTLARLDQGRTATNAPVDLGRLAGEAVDAVRVADGDRTYDLDVAVDRPTTITGDADQLRQVLDNLLANARSHTPAGTEVLVRVRAVGDDSVVVDVVDDGPGIRPEDRTHAFDRFWRSKRADESDGDGAGLGLSIVQSIVSAHGGDVHLGEATSGGAHFSLRFPTEPPASPVDDPGATT